MQSQHYTPSPFLTPFVKSFWTIHSSVKDTNVFRFAPDGHPELFFSLAGNIIFRFNGKKLVHKSDFGIIGHFEHNVDMDISQNRLTFLIKFHAHSLNALIPENCNTLINGINSLPLMAGLYRQLVDMYNSNSDILQIIACVEKWLIAHLHPFSQQDLVAGLCNHIQAGYRNPVSEILGNYSLSQRRLQQIFKEKVGISPKQFQRLHRFRIAMKQIGTISEKEAFIYSLGYHDWSHFSKDMSYFFEMSPSDYIHYLFQQGQLINVQR